MPQLAGMRKGAAVPCLTNTCTRRFSSEHGQAGHQKQIHTHPEEHDMKRRLAQAKKMKKKQAKKAAAKASKAKPGGSGSTQSSLRLSCCPCPLGFPDAAALLIHAHDTGHH